VPILLCVLLVIAYNVAGAFLFQMWEGWSFLDRWARFPDMRAIFVERLSYFWIGKPYS
jgi:hypothetical protein